jgi:hypothetical protein
VSGRRAENPGFRTGRVWKTRFFARVRLSSVLVKNLLVTCCYQEQSASSSGDNRIALLILSLIEHQSGVLPLS